MAPEELDHPVPCDRCLRLVVRYQRDKAGSRETLGDVGDVGREPPPLLYDDKTGTAPSLGQHEITVSSSLIALEFDLLLNSTFWSKSEPV